jgi:L,D-peptidoglycan transpeptidase YkuD (ErfK/YbiS/YcfS/YnhG family)
MRPLLQALLLVALAPAAFAKPPRTPRTLITVVTADWTATSGELRRFARDDGERWRAVGEPVPVVVGKAGLAWPSDKREGDGRAPAGRLALGVATGYDDAPAGTKLRYFKADAALRCVDDPTSPRYNTLATAPATGAPPWASDEKMRRDDELYRLTIFVRHNLLRTPRRGSCIFLHVWRDAGTPTVGCTAMALPALRDLVTWVDSSTELVQLPRAEYARLQRAWDLPPLPDAQRK